MPLIRHIVTSFVIVLVLLALLLLAFIGTRYLGFEQVDDADHIAAKNDYLDQVGAIPLFGDAPNILFILYDDMGYGDIGAGAHAAASIRTPNLDTLAEGGVVLTDFYSPSPVCTPARAGYLTGRLAPRAGLPNVVFPSGSVNELITILMDPGVNLRLPEEEITLAEVLRAAGYRTGMIGKWHLGDVSPSLPNDRGFEEFFGARYSNDMEPFALYRNDKVEIPAPVDQRRLTEWYNREAISFIETGDAPFFLYYAHNFPHDPLHVRDERLGTSDGGLYGDVLEEIDDGIGEIVTALRRAGQLDNTLIIITSDNGPWFLGSAGDQRGRKGNTFEGGMRVPFIAHWPAVIPGGRTESAMAMGIDIFPTVLEMLDLPLPDDRYIDGRSMIPTLVRGAPTAHDFLYFIDGETLFAVRDQRFKYRGAAGVFYSTDQMGFGRAVPQKEWLFDLELDRRESYDTSARHPDRLSHLREAFEFKRSEMLDNPRGWTESDVVSPQ